MNPTQNILIVGVGGQGVLLASELLSEVAFDAGFDVKKSEVHGMAQRGGVVSSHVRFGEKVYSPLIPSGDADVLLAFEQAEAKRWIHFVKPGGSVIINERKLTPPIAFMKTFEYPKDPIADVRARVQNLYPINATEIAIKIGNLKVENITLLGALSHFLEIDEILWMEGIEKRVPKGTVEINQNAFRKGRELMQIQQ